MGRRQKERRNGDIHLAIGDDVYTSSRLTGYVRIVEENLRGPRNEAGAENLHARQSYCRSKRCLRNESVGDTTNYAWGGNRAWNDHFHEFRSLFRAEDCDFQLPPALRC